MKYFFTDIKRKDNTYIEENNELLKLTEYDII